MLNFLQKIGGRRIARDAMWTAGGQLVSAVAFLASVRIMTEILSPDEFGRLALMLGVSALALGLSATPRLQALMRYYPDWWRTGEIGALRKTGGEVVGRTVLFSAAVILCGWFTYTALFGGQWYVGLLIATILIVDSIRSFELSLFNAARRQRDAALLLAADAWSRPLLAIAVITSAGASATAALAGYAAGSTLVIAIIRLAMPLEGSATRNTPAPLGGFFPPRTDAQLAQAIRRYAFPLAPLAIFGWFSGVGDRYVIAGLLNMHDAGLYAAVYGLASRPFLMLSGIIELTLRPVLYDAIAARNGKLIKQSKRALVIASVMGGAAGVFGFALLSDFVGQLLLAPEYRNATDLMPWVALGYAFYGLSNVFSRFCYAFDDTKAVLILTVAGTLSGLAVLVTTLHLGGLAGAVLAVPAQFGVELALSILLARRAEHRFYGRVFGNSNKGTQ